MSNPESNAMATARKVAEFLKKEYGATRVILFGSLAKGFFEKDSDIDIYFEGVPRARIFSAVGHCLETFRDSELDLKPASLCEKGFRNRILQEGIVL